MRHCYLIHVKSACMRNMFYNIFFLLSGKKQVSKLRTIYKQTKLLTIMNNNENITGSLPLKKEHICFDKGHTFYLVCECDNGRSKYGEHKCSRCGHVEEFQFDYA